VQAFYERLGEADVTTRPASETAELILFTAAVREACALSFGGFADHNWTRGGESGADGTQRRAPEHVISQGLEWSRDLLWVQRHVPPGGTMTNDGGEARASPSTWVTRAQGRSLLLCAEVRRNRDGGVQYLEPSAS